MFFTSPNNAAYLDDLNYILQLCDKNSVPLATNIATAEMLIMGLNRGDLDYREILYPRKKQVIL
jgi:methylglyoxal synthase